MRALSIRTQPTEVNIYNSDSVTERDSFLSHW